MRYVLTFAAAILIAASAAVSAEPTGNTEAPAHTSLNDADRAAMALLAKGRMVTLKVPSSVLSVDGASFAGALILAASPTVTADGTSTFPGLEWKTAGFPSMWEMKIEKIDRKKEHTQIELRSAMRYVKLRFSSSLDTVQLARGFSSLVIPGDANSAAASAYRDEAYRVLAAAIFVDKLAAVPVEAQAALVRVAHEAAGAGIRSQVYKDNLYLVVDLGRDTSVYNDLRFTQASVLAHVLNESLLKTLKGFAEPVKNVSQLHGIKVEFGIPHKSFLEEYARPATYAMELYAPADLIRKFADADITTQQFVDGCVLIVDENRVEVSLTASGG